MVLKDVIPLLKSLLANEPCPEGTDKSLKRWLETILLSEHDLKAHIRWLQEQAGGTRSADEIDMEVIESVLRTGVASLDSETTRRLLLSPVDLYELWDRVQEVVTGEVEDDASAEIWLEALSRLGEEFMKENDLGFPEFKPPADNTSH